VSGGTGLDVHSGYLTKHLKAGHLAYGQFRRQGLPLGSGAVESAIRRVINLRLKGPGLMWLAENAEGALVLRAAAVTGRWEETLSWVREELGTDRQLKVGVGVAGYAGAVEGQGADPAARATTGVRTRRSRGGCMTTLWGCTPDALNLRHDSPSESCRKQGHGVRYNGAISPGASLSTSRFASIS
jgi:hypothetical protein